MTLEQLALLLKQRQELMQEVGRLRRMVENYPESKRMAMHLKAREDDLEELNRTEVV